MPLEARRLGPGSWGLPVMKFNLTYEGPLPSSGNSRKTEDIWRIRLDLQPQLQDLWESHPALQSVLKNRYFPKIGGSALIQTHHQHGGPIHELARAQTIGRETGGTLDLCEPLTKHGQKFFPLVRETFALHCGLRILFLRREPPGKVYQGGDLDGRMKTLLDALAMPQHKEQVFSTTYPDDPIYCLMQDDSMISGIDVQSERLLGMANKGADYAKLTIEVDVRVREATVYNQSFLG